MAVVRKAAAQAAPAPAGVNFGDLGFYSSGFVLPAGQYALFFDARVHAYTKQDGSKGQEMLGVMVTAYPLAGGDPQEQFLSMGKKAILSFAPNADDPAPNGIGSHSLLPIPGGPAATLAGQTNWNLFLKSLYDAGLPPGTFTNSFSTIDGVWVQTGLEPEPEGRKSFGAATGEVEQEQKHRGPQMIPVVTEILEDGKPWEGGGGMPEAAEAPAPKAAPKVAPKAAAKAPVAAAKAAPAPAKKAAPAPAPAAEAGDEETMQAAVDAVTSVLEKNPNGTTKLLLRTQTFKAVKEAAGDETAQAVIDTFFSSDDALNSVVGQLGYTVQGAHIKAA